MMQSESNWQSHHACVYKLILIGGSILVGQSACNFFINCRQVLNVMMRDDEIGNFSDFIYRFGSLSTTRLMHKSSMFEFEMMALTASVTIVTAKCVLICVKFFFSL